MFWLIRAKPVDTLYPLFGEIIIATSERAPASELGATLIFGWASCVSDASSILDLCFQWVEKYFFHVTFALTSYIVRSRRSFGHL